MGCLKLHNFQFFDTKTTLKWAVTNITLYYPPDSYPFGSAMKEYTNPLANDSAGYRYGFNGMEHDNESFNDAYDFGARIYDGRLGRWLAVDPLTAKYPSLSPYNFCDNNSIAYKDIDGKDFIVTISIDERGNTVFTVTTTIYVKNEIAKKEVDNAISAWKSKSYQKDNFILNFNVKSQIDACVVQNLNQNRTDAPEPNTYHGFERNKGSDFTSRKVDGYSYGTLGLTVNGHAIFMNMSTDKKLTFSSFYAGDNSILVGHELGHLFGFEDENELDGYGIMNYLKIKNRLYTSKRKGSIESMVCVDELENLFDDIYKNYQKELQNNTEFLIPFRPFGRSSGAVYYFEITGKSIKPYEPQPVEKLDIGTEVKLKENNNYSSMYEW